MNIGAANKASSGRLGFYRIFKQYSGFESFLTQAPPQSCPPPLTQIVTMLKDALLHYLVGHYTTQQPDGVHIEAHCTCGMKLEGVGKMKARR